MTLIVPRNLSFAISRHARPLWLDGDVFRTAIFDCFAIFLPEGESFFVCSIARFKAVADDAETKRDIDAFMQQEALHAREHKDYNRGLKKLGHDTDAMEEPGRRLLRERVTAPRDALAMTCAIEHITAHWRS